MIAAAQSTVRFKNITATLSLYGRCIKGNGSHCLKSGPGKKVALHQVNACIAQCIAFCGCFYSFCNHFNVHCFTHLHHAAHNGATGAVSIKVAHQPHVQLDQIGLKVGLQR